MKNHNLRLCIVFLFMVSIFILLSFLLKAIDINNEEVYIKLIDKIGNGILGNVDKQNMLFGILGSVLAIIISSFLMLTPFIGLELLFILIHSQICRLHSKANRVFFLLLNVSPLVLIGLIIKTGIINFTNELLISMLLPLLICFSMLAISSIVIFIFKKQKVQ